MDTGEVLFEHGLLTDSQLTELRSGIGGDRLDLAAVKRGWVSEQQTLAALGDHFGFECVDLEKADVDLSLLSTFPSRLIHRHALFPVSRDNGSLVVATSDPFDLYPLDELSGATGLSVEPVLAPSSQINARIKTHLGVGSETVDGLLAAAAGRRVELLEEIDADDAELSEEAQEASVVRLVNEILLEAIESRASDVHIESQAAGPADPLPDRRRAAAAAGAAGDQPLPGGDHQPPEDHGPAEHRREAPAAGRPHQAQGARPRGRRPRVGHPDDPRRRDRDASARQGAHGVLAAQARHGRATSTRSSTS